MKSAGSADSTAVSTAVAGAANSHKVEGRGGEGSHISRLLERGAGDGHLKDESLRKRKTSVCSCSLSFTAYDLCTGRPVENEFEMFRKILLAAGRPKSCR